MENRNSRNKKILDLEHWQQITLYLIIYDAIAVSLSYFFALLLRFDFRFSQIPLIYLQPWEYFAPIYAVICIVVFWRLRLYKSIWRFASYTELQRVTLATAVTTVIHIIGVTVIINVIVVDSLYTISRMPLSYYIMGAMLQFLFITAIRFSYRFILLLRAARTKQSASKIMLIGLDSIIGTTQGIYWNFSNSGILAPNQIIRSGVGELQPVVY